MTPPFTEAHENTRETARNFLQAWYDGGKGPERISRSGDIFDEQAWHIFAKELGMAGIAIELAYGGAGQGDVGRVIVMEALGASLCAIPYLTTCGIVTDILQIAGEPIAKNRYLKKIAAGELKAAYCDGHDAIGKVVRQVAHAAEADLLVISRRGEGGMDYLAIAKGTPGLVVTPENTSDPTRKPAAVDWKDVAEGDFIPIGYGSEEQHDKLVTQSFIALAAESVGGAQKCLDIVTENLALGEVDDQCCGDMLARIEAARAAVYRAVIAPPDARTQAALITKTLASETFLNIAEDALRVTRENGSEGSDQLQRFFNRASANITLFGAQHAVINAKSPQCDNPI